MKNNLYSFSWYGFTRSANFGKSLGTKILLGFLAVYFFAVFFGLGMSISKILPEKFPDQDPVFIFNGFLLAYVGIDLLIRQLMQSLPTVQVKPFLILNIRRNRIIRYLMGRSLVNFFNILPLFMLIPVSITLISPAKGSAAAMVWLAGMIVLVFSNHFLSTWLKWKFNDSGYGFYVFAAIIAGLFALDYFAIFDLKELFASGVQFLFSQPLILLALLVLPVLFYFLNTSYLKSRFYLDLLDPAKKDEKIRDFSWLNNLGEYGKFIALDLRLIWRNKRPRSQVLMSFLFLAYGLLIYKGGDTPDFMLVLGGAFMVSMFTAVYGQFFPAWHSKYYSMLMVQNFRMKQFLQSFYILNLVVCCILYLLTLPYAFIQTQIIFTHFMLLLYNLGVNTYMIFLFGLSSKKAVELEGGAMFNYQGVGAAQWLISLPLFFLPIILFFLFKLVLDFNEAFAALGGIGLIGILLQPVLINYFSKAYLKRKHQLIKNYKNS